MPASEVLFKCHYTVNRISIKSVKTQITSILCLVGIAVLSGCVTSPQTGGTTSSAYAVGDRGQITLDEVVVSLPLRGVASPYQNLHIGLAAIVNPQKVTLYDPNTVEQIVRRLEARISSRLLESLSGLGQQVIDDLPALRKRIASDAQNVVDSALQQWQHASEYRVEVVVVALYWTDSSVGRAAQQKRWLW